VPIPDADTPEGDVTQPPAPAPAELPDATARWGEFRIISELGHGGFGRVFLAFDEGLAKHVALKIVRATDPARIPAVLREGRMLARVNHPNVVTVHAVRQVGDEIGFVMELIDGESLADRVRRTGRMGAEEAVSIGQTLCQALAAVHAAGLLHRDIKARNVMRDSSGRIMLMDFGAGRELTSGESRDDLTGTPSYLAPELFKGAPASPASDIYSLGVLLYYLVTGAYPVEGHSVVELAIAHATGTRHLLVDRRPDLPQKFIRVVDRALAPELPQRYNGAGALLDDLNAIATRGALPAPPRAAHLGRWSAVAAAGLATVVLFGFLATRAYDNAFDLGRFADDSLGTWVRVGIQALVPPMAWVILTAVVWLIVRTIWHTAESAVRPLQRLTERVRSSLSSVVRRSTPRDHNVLARALLLGQVAVVGVLILIYRHQLLALVTPFDHCDPAVWQALFYSSDQVGPVNHYQALLPIAATVMGLAWRRLIKSAGGIATLDRPVVAAGFALILLLVAGVTIPFRVFYNANLQLTRYEIDDERCYEVGRKDDLVRLFCPDVVPGPNRSRNQNVKQDDPRLQRPLPVLSPYAARPKTP
jgi:hypothetical protein